MNRIKIWAKKYPHEAGFYVGFPHLTFIIILPPLIPHTDIYASNTALRKI